MSMLLVLIGLLMFIGIAVAVKLFDSEIRASRYGKNAVVYLFFLAIIFIAAGIIKIIGGF